MPTFNLNKRNILLTILAGLLLFLPFLVDAQSASRPAGEGDALKELSWLQSALWTLVTTVFGFFVWLGGMMLNEGVTEFVVNFGDQFANSGFGFAVNNLWVVMRDFFNLFFIFGLVYIGFQMILKSGDTNARRLLVHIILAALLVNFSLFFTKVIIDFTNIAATQIATSFPAGSVPGDIGISDAFMNILGLQGSLDAGGALALNQINASGGYAYIFFSMILFIIAAFVFAVGGILLFIRFVVLNIYMILSPLMFLGWVFPNLASYSQLYWKNFLGRAFFAPAYLLMIYFAYVVLDEFAGLLEVAPDYSSLVSGNASAAASFGTTLPFFFFTAIFLIAAVVVAQKMGAEGASLAVSLGRDGARRIGKATGKVTIAGLNRTGGYGANRLANLQGFRGLAAKHKSFEYAHKATLGLASGYEKRQKEKAKADVKYAEKLGEIKTRDSRTNKILPEVGAQIGANIKKTIKENEAYQGIENNRKAAEANVKKFSTDLEKKKEEFKTEKEQNRVKLTALEDKLKNETDATAKKNIEADIDKTKGEIKASEDKFSSEITNLQTTLKEHTGKLTETKKTEQQMYETVAKSEEGKIQFQNQLTFADRKEKEAARYTSGKVQAGAAGAAGGGAAIGAAAGGYAVAPLLVAPVITSSFGKDAESSARELRKIYGDDGARKIEREQKKKDFKLQEEIRKDIMGGDQTPKNNEGGDTNSQTNTTT